MNFKKMWIFFLIFSFSCNLNMSDNTQSSSSSSSKFLGNIIGITTSEPSKFSIYWDQVTPENSGKWGFVESTRDSMNWTTMDFIYNYSKQKGFAVKFHTIVWGSQEPLWISILSTNEQMEEIIEWYSNISARYPDLDMIDVVNEPLHAPPSFKNALGGNGATGWDWVVKSFQMARQYFPNSKLLINDYGIIGDPNAARQYTNIIMILKKSNLIDGIGIQCHYFNMNTVSTTTMREVLQILGSTGLPIYVSELDIQGSTDTEQLNRYKEKFPILWEDTNIKGVTLWGYIEGTMWISDAHLLRANGTERPALTWLTNYVKTGVK